ncbi:MAG: hypothetical protein Q9216_005921 [Gyalolechia sp. 2 TL-2023]
MASQVLTNGDHSPRQAFGRRLLPKVLDQHANLTPERLYASVARSAQISDGCDDITCHDMANAVNGLAHWLDENIGHASEVETLAYVGIPDLRTPILLLSAIKCGYRALLLSPRNTLAADLSLIEQTKCTKLCYSRELTSQVRGIQESLGDGRYAEVPSLQEMLQFRSPPYPYDYSFDEVAERQILILHSSGSTGLPKPIFMTHGTFATMDNDRNLPTKDGRKRLDFTIWDFKGGGRFYTAFPPFHLAGVVATASVVVPIFSEKAAPVLGPFTRPPSGAIVKDIMCHYQLKSMFVPPSIIEQVLQEAGGFDELGQLEWLAYTGGPLSPSAGDAVSKVVDLCQYFGITETLPLQQLIPPREDWSYIEWNPCRRIELQPSDDDSYELVVFSDDTTGRISGLDHNYPGVKEWRTKDLFKQHPKKPNLWRFHGRKDDIMVLSNGEKFYPIPMESFLQGHPLVAGALVVGQGRFQAALLIEPQPSPHDGHSLIKEIWPLVEQANRLVPAQGQITGSKVLVVPPNKPFERAGKGTIIRRLTEQAFAPEIKALYDNESLNGQDDTPRLTKPFDLAKVRQFVRDCVVYSVSIPHITDEDDIFVLGVDSLKAVTIGSLLRSGLGTYYDRSGLDWMSDKTLYTYPSIELMSEQIHNFLNKDSVAAGQSSGGRPSRTEKMDSLIEKYTHDLPTRSAPTTPSRKANGIHVALTGSTGTLGPHLFQALLADTSISHIYVLNRSPNARERHHSICSQSNLPPPPDSKVTYLTADFSIADFGVSPAALSTLHSNVHVIIHNAWKVDFKHSFLSYEAIHIRGTRHLIDFSLASPHLPRIVFVSSASAVGNWVIMHKTRGDAAPPAIPESFIHDADAAQQMGYGESKHVAERILETASTRCGVPVTVLRIGQIGGSTRFEDPAWPQQEWIPSVIKTAKSVKVLPNRLAPVEWIPVDQLALIIGEIMHVDLNTFGNDEEQPSTAKVYNLVNPKAVDWASLLPVLQRKLHIDTVVDLKDWIALLAQFDGMDLQELDGKPALKLLDLLTDLEAGSGDLVFATDGAREVSRTMRGMEAVGDELMCVWLDQWGF